MTTWQNLISSERLRIAPNLRDLQFRHENNKNNDIYDTDFKRTTSTSACNANVNK